MEGSAVQQHDRQAHKKRALRLLRDVLRGLRWRYGGFVLATIAFALVAMLPPELLRFFTERTETLSGASAPDFLRQLAWFGGLVAASLLLSSVANTFLHEWLRLRLEADLRRRVLHRLHDVPLGLLDGVQRGDWMARITGDLVQVELFLADSIPSQVRQAVILVGAGVLFIVHSGTLALLPLATALVLAATNLRMQKKLADVLLELRVLHGGVFQHLLESLEGVRTIRSHRIEPFLERRFEAKLGEITTKSLKVIRFYGCLLGSNEAIAQLMITACLTGVAWSLTRGKLTLQEVLVYPFFIGMFYTAAQSLAGAAYDWNRFFTEGGRLAELLQGAIDRDESHRPTPAKAPEGAFRLIVRDVTIGDDKRAIAGPLGFELRRGECLAVMGASGSGKSTFLETVAGLRPALAGTAALADATGHALWDSSRDKRGGLLPVAACAYVEQRPHIFEGTLRENLVFGNPDRSSDAVLWAGLERAGLLGFAQRYGGLDYKLQDRGANLSEGERYRIALCRALLLRRPFLLLDEPFAAQDEASIAVIVRAITEEKKRAGVLVVTHTLPEELPLDGILDVGVEKELDLLGDTSVWTPLPELPEERVAHRSQ